MTFLYPKPRRDESIVDNFHGVDVPDPYRWLEQLEWDETKTFINSQNAVSNSYLKGVKYREQIKKSISDMQSFPNFEAPMKEGEHYFQFRSSNTQNLDILYYGNTLDKLGVHKNIFFNPNSIATTSEFEFIGVKFSKFGRIMAYSFKYYESDFYNIKFQSIDGSKTYNESLVKVKHGEIEWYYDEGIFYSVYVGQNGKIGGSDMEFVKSQHIHFHRIGTEQSDDIIVFSHDYLNGHLSMNVSYCENYLIATHSRENHGTTVDVVDITDNFFFLEKLEFKPIIEKHEAKFVFITNNDNLFLFQTNGNAPHSLILIIDIKQPQSDNWRILVKELSNEILETSLAVNNSQLVLLYRVDGRHLIKVHDMLTGDQIAVIPLEIGVVKSLSGKRDNEELFIKFESMIIPCIIYRVDLTKDNIKADVFQEVRLRKFENYELSQVLYTSIDKTQIPMYILHKKGIIKNSGNPCIICFYEEETSDVFPIFSVLGLFFVCNFNGIYAVANIRGCGKPGELWHSAGSLENQNENSINDLLCAANYLFKNNYTKTSKLIMYGNSKGGLLVGICSNVLPEICGASVIINADLDLLRYNQLKYTCPCLPEFGSPDNAEQFKFLYKYSPLHNIKVPKKKNQYPATFLISDFEKNAATSQSLKYIATMQHKLGKLEQQRNPLMLKINKKFGHKKLKTKFIDDLVDIFCFIGKTIDLHFDSCPEKFNKPILQ